MVRTINLISPQYQNDTDLHPHHRGGTRLYSVVGWSASASPTHPVRRPLAVNSLLASVQTDRSRWDLRRPSRLVHRVDPRSQCDLQARTRASRRTCILPRPGVCALPAGR